MTLNGIDISYAQTATPPLTGLDFVFVQRGFGSSVIPGGNVDVRYDQHAANVRAAGLALGAYWFWYDGQNNAYAVRDLLTSKADFLALDLEGTNANTPSGQAQAADFITRVHAAGWKIGLYHSLSDYPNVGQDWNWVAAWGFTSLPIGWTFWQHRGAPLDLDYFNGDKTALAAFIEVQNMYAIDTRTPLVAPNPRQFTIPANTTLNGYDPAQPGKVVKTFGPSPTPSVAHADATDYVAWYGTPTPPVPRGGPFLHVLDGPLAGLLVVAALVTLSPATPVVVPSVLASGVYRVL